MTNLKPCPFCGNKVELEVKSFGYGKDYHEHCMVIRCDFCGFEFPKKSITIRANWDASEFKYANDMTKINEAVELWNKRAVMSEVVEDD